jgi:hypothetical protein
MKHGKLEDHGGELSLGHEPAWVAATAVVGAQVAAIAVRISAESDLEPVFLMIPAR